MYKVFLIRHGESGANVGLAATAPQAVQLTLQGHQQAKQVAAVLMAYTSLDLIITSRYQRTVQTARPTMREFHSATTGEWDVEEFTYLSSTYLGYTTIDERRPLVEAYWEQCQPFFQDGPESESFEMFMERVYKFIGKLEDSYYENIAVFSHEQFMNAVIWVLTVKRGRFAITSQTMREFRLFLDQHRIPNGGIVELTFHPIRNEWNYEIITAHLQVPVEEMEEELSSIN